MRLLLIDNYDSFTFNLAHLIATTLGTEPVVLAHDDPRLDLDLAEGFDGIVISPGPGRPGVPSDVGVCEAILRDTTRPVLGVCLGLQCIVHLFGGRVDRVEPVHGRIRAIEHEGHALFHGIPTGFDAVRYHSLGCLELPPVLEAIAWTREGLCMAARHRTRPIWGVQFHPESACSAYGAELIANFGRLAAACPAPTRVAEVEPPLPRAVPVDAEPWTAALHTRRLALPLSAAAVFEALYWDAPHAFWLDGETAGTASILGDASGPLAEVVRYEVGSRTVEIRSRRGLERRRQSIFDYLAGELRRRHRPGGDPRAFNLGYVGYLGYELKADAGGAAGHASDLPDASLIFADRAVVVDDRGLTLMALDTDPGRAGAWMDAVEDELSHTDPVPAPVPSADVQRPVDPRHEDPAYMERVEACQELIRRGESYELCLTNTWRVPARVDPVELFTALRTVNPAPYAGLYRDPLVALACASPERFLAIDAHGHAVSEPIKGTTARGRTPTEDVARAGALAHSEKDRSENLMIVDLVRHDLGRVCETGSVHVDALFRVESHPTVHQLVSQISGRLRPEVHAVDAVRACFPGGSMTGAPKVRTMELLDALEQGPRGPYSGALGWFALSGAVDLAIVIRTLVIAPDEVRIGVGGAVVHLSDPAAELAEARLKGAALLEALARVAPMRQLRAALS